MAFLWITSIPGGSSFSVETTGLPVRAHEKPTAKSEFETTLTTADDQAPTSFAEIMALPAHQLTNSYLFPWYNNVDLKTQLLLGNVSSSSTTVTVTIAGSVRGSYSLQPHETIRLRYSGLNSGPVKVEGPAGVPFLALEQMIYSPDGISTSFSELMGLPAEGLDSTYWLPWYNNVDLDSQLRVGNVSSSRATVHIYIGQQEMPGSPFTLEPGTSTRMSFAGINSGPVRIESDVNIVSTMRVIYKVNGRPVSFSETMALPDLQLDTTYLFAWYNNVDLDTQLRIGNASGSTATVHVSIAGQEMPGSPFTLESGTSLRTSFPGINAGPAMIESDVPIVAAERVIYKINRIPTSFSEMLGLPQSQLDTTYWLPWFNNVDLDTQVRFGNVGESAATVHVFAGDREMTGSCLPTSGPYTLAPDQSLRVTCAGINNGPLHVTSTDGQPILVSERVIYRGGFPLTSTAYYVSPNGNDGNPGTLAQPWKTIQKAVNTVRAGDTIYVRAGEYSTDIGSPTFKNSGTETQPITLSNYPGEQIVIRLAGNPAFFCWWRSATQSPMVSYIRILGTDVAERTLSNGVISGKGIVIQGRVGEQVHGINGHGCDFWEVAGVDFVDVGSGIFNFKNNDRQNVDNSADHWYVHDNRVYGFYRESGMQFNTDNNRIEYNEIYKVTDRVDTPYGCQLLNILGDSNVVRGNILSRRGSRADCTGLLFEWDLADANTVEQNRIFDVTGGIDFQGGDNNVIRNNVIYVPAPSMLERAGIGIFSHSDSKTDWPCNEETGSAQALLPPNDASHPDYQFYYNPRNCHSFGNQIYNNVIHEFVEGIRFYPLVGENTTIRNNVFSGWSRGSICHYNSDGGACNPPPASITADHNAEQSPFGFVDLHHFDFHLSINSLLIDAGYDLGSLNPNDFDGNPRPQDQGFDIGAYEFVSTP